MPPATRSISAEASRRDVSSSGSSVVSRAARVEELTARLATLDAPDLGVLREASALIERIVRDTSEGA